MKSYYIVTPGILHLYQRRVMLHSIIKIIKTLARGQHANNEAGRPTLPWDATMRSAFCMIWDLQLKLSPWLLPAPCPFCVAVLTLCFGVSVRPKPETTACWFVNTLAERPCLCVIGSKRLWRVAHDTSSRLSQLPISMSLPLKVMLSSSLPRFSRVLKVCSC